MNSARRKSHARITSWFSVAAAISIVLAGCGDDDNPSTDTGIDTTDVGNDSTDTSDVEPDSIDDVGSDSDVGTDSDIGTDVPTDGDPSDTTPAIVDSISIVASPSNALAAYVDIETVDGTEVVVRLMDDTRIVNEVASSEAGSSHSVFVWGMQPESEYTVVVIATANGSDEQHNEPHTSGSLPSDFPPITVPVADTDNMAPGLTLFTTFRWNPSPDSEWSYVAMVDETGTPVWYNRLDGSGAETRVLPSGNIGVVANDELFIELDIDGTIINEVSAEDIGTDSIHHEWYTMPDGNIVFLSSELRVIDGYDDGDGGTVSHNVIADVVVEVDADMNIVHEHSLFDILDPLEPNPSFNNPFWNAHYADVAPDGTKDWTHSNAVIYDASDDSFIVSVRHMDAIIKMDRATGDLVWRFGVGGDFDLTDGEFSLHTHAPELQADGSLLLFDNGNNRETDTPYSRAVRYELDASAVDPADWTATQVWEHTDGYYAPFVGDADTTSVGTVLVTAGGLIADPTSGIGAPDNQKSARIYEVTTDGTIVFDMTIIDELSEDPIGYTVYRAERIDATSLNGVDE